MPEEYGGAGLGITEAALMMQAIAESGAGLSRRLGRAHEHLRPQSGRRVRHRRAEAAHAAAADRGQEKACFAVTEPNAGLNTTQLKTRARARRRPLHPVNGQKIWISTAQVADKMLLLARTTPLEQVQAPTDGLTLFYTDLDRAHVEVREIDKMGRKAVDSNQVFIDGLPVPVEDRIGEEGKGFEYILHGMNPERILIAAEAVGLGRAALARATRYAKERVVFDRPIGQNQAIQHPLARMLDGAGGGQPDGVQGGVRSTTSGKPCGAEANAAKYLAGEAGFRGLRAGGDDAWRHGLRQGVPRRALPARSADPAHRAGQPAADPVLHRREACSACRSRIRRR